MNLIDRLTRSGRVAELYKFTRDSEYWDTSTVITPEYWYLTNCVHPIDYEFRTYAPSSVNRSRIEETEDPFKSIVNLEFHISDPFASQFIGQTPDFPTMVEIYRTSVDNVVGDTSIYWKGRCSSATVKDGIITIACDPIHTTLQALGLRARYERACRHIVYSPECQLQRDEFRLEGEVQEVGLDFLRIKFARQDIPDGYFTSGYIQLPSGALRFVTEHIGESLKLSRAYAAKVNVYDKVYVYPGCNQTREHCHKKFNNIENFGGWSWIPSTNPFKYSVF